MPLLVLCWFLPHTVPHRCAPLEHYMSTGNRKIEFMGKHGFLRRHPGRYFFGILFCFMLLFLLVMLEKRFFQLHILVLPPALPRFWEMVTADRRQAKSEQLKQEKLVLKLGTKASISIGVMYLAYSWDTESLLCAENLENRVIWTIKNVPCIIN